MGDIGTSSELESELIKRNREIAKVRDDVLKTERKLEQSNLRNDELLEKCSDLDAEITRKATQLREMEEKVQDSENALAQKCEDIEMQRKEYIQQMEDLRTELLENGANKQKEIEAQEIFRQQVNKLEEEKVMIRKEVDDEKQKHMDTKARLEQAESSIRDLMARNNEQSRQLQELEEQMIEKEASVSNTAAQQLEEERAKMGAELHRVSTLYEEHKGVREDLESQARDQEKEIMLTRAELEDMRRELADQLGTVADLEAARDDALKKYEDHIAMHDDVIQAEKKRHEENFQRAMQQAASMDGRLSGQRLLMEEVTEALQKSELAEEMVAADLSAKVDELRKEYSAGRDMLLEHEDKATRIAAARDARYNSELESEEVVLRRHAHAEIDRHSRIASEAEEQQRRLEARFHALHGDHEEAQTQHTRLAESVRTQNQDLRNRLADAEELVLTHQQEVDYLRKDLDEAKLVLERTVAANKLELERLQQTLEAEGQSRNSTEKIAESRLEEKQTILQQREASIANMERDLEENRRRIAELEMMVEKAKEEVGVKAHEMVLRNAQLEGEVRIRQENLTEVEGRLEAQRQYMDQMNVAFNQAQIDRDGLLAEKGALEAQLKLELSHKDAVNKSLQQSQDESARLYKEIDEARQRDHDNHRTAIEEVKRSVGEELAHGAERLAAAEAELLTMRQRCELLQRNKADLQAEVEEHRNRYIVLEAGIEEHRVDKEKLSFEIDHHRQNRSELEQDCKRLQEERQECDVKINELMEKVRTMEDQKISQYDEFGAKIKNLDDLINAERELREAAEHSLLSARKEAEDQIFTKEQESRRTEQELRVNLESWREKAEEAEALLTQSREQLDANRVRMDGIDIQRREVEANLRSEAASNESKLQRLQAEMQRAQIAIEDGKAVLAQQHAAMTTKISNLERQLEQETNNSRCLLSAKQAAESELERQTDNLLQQRERLNMSSEEFFTRQVAFTLEKQRLSGALEESRRTLRNSLGVPNPVAAVDSVRISGLEQQLSEERRKSIEQVVAFQRSERRCKQLEETYKRIEEQRSDAVQQAREAERRCAAVTEELRKNQIRQGGSQQKHDEARERAAMASAEISTVKYEAKYEAAKLRGALDELRFMLKMQDGPSPSIGSRFVRR